MFDNYIYSRPFHAHELIKDNLLSIIDQYCLEKIKTPEGDIISKTDWLKDEQIFYKKELAVHFTDHLIRTLNYPKIEILQIWFQQYQKHDRHNWHVHEYSHFTNVYFLQLPDEKYKTEIKNLNGEVIDYEAKEGDILTFPGFLPHRSPIIKDDIQKTIVSFNITLTSIEN